MSIFEWSSVFWQEPRGGRVIWTLRLGEGTGQRLKELKWHADSVILLQKALLYPHTILGTSCRGGWTPSAADSQTVSDVLFQLSVCDPVHVVALDKFVLSQLNRMQTTLGDAAFNLLMQTIDSEIVQQLQMFMTQWLRCVDLFRCLSFYF